MNVEADNISRLVLELYAVERGNWGRHLIYGPAIQQAIAYRSTMTFSAIPEDSLQEAEAAIFLSYKEICEFIASSGFKLPREYCDSLMFSASAVRRIRQRHFTDSDLRPQLIGYLIELGLGDRDSEMMSEVLIGPQTVYNGGAEHFRAFINAASPGLEQRLLRFFAAELKALNIIFRNEAFTTPYGIGAVEAAQRIISRA